MLLLLLLTAVLLRFWQLGDLPPGLYRDEAYNGLDALAVLDGEHRLFFPANNGREPAYIYLTAAAVAVFGRSPLAVRLGAAVAGILITLLTYRLGTTWFNRRVGFFAALLWAITLWPVHLSRIGLRPILLILCLTATFWLGALAYRRRDNRLWLLAGLVYGLSYYTYLAARFTPLLVATLAACLLWRKGWRTLWPGALWFGVGTAIVLLPFAFLVIQQPDLLLGRTGQVSILNPAVNDGDLWGALGENVGRALGMFFWRGDTILRHNPAGRPVFSWLMAGPFLLGVGWCLWRWRRPAAMAVLLWTAVMLGPTILAEDTPHFLRAAGILPGALLLPALGLEQLWTWFRLPKVGRIGLVLLLSGGSLFLTMRDYLDYAQNPDTGYLFEAAARTLSEEANDDVGVLPETAVFIADRFWSGWPSIPFLVTTPHAFTFTPEGGLPPLNGRTELFVWPHEPRDYIPPSLPPQAVVWTETGPPARGDLEPDPYPLYAHYLVTPNVTFPVQATFGEVMTLHEATAAARDGRLQVDLIWGAETAVSPPLTVFIHLVGPDGVAAQSDAPPGKGNWSADWWRPGLLLHDRHLLDLPPDFERVDYQLMIGLYDPALDRLPVTAVDGSAAGDSWRIPIER